VPGGPGVGITLEFVMCTHPARRSRRLEYAVGDGSWVADLPQARYVFCRRASWKRPKRNRTPGSVPLGADSVLPIWLPIARHISQEPARLQRSRPALPDAGATLSIDYSVIGAARRPTESIMAMDPSPLHVRATRSSA